MPIPSDPATVVFGQNNAPVKFAIGSFYGFYFNAVKFHPDYCKSLGVDLSDFVTAFKRMNEDAYRAAAHALLV